jgi:hypothetical protein
MQVNSEVTIFIKLLLRITCHKHPNMNLRN